MNHQHPTTTTNPKISQETYDETLLENQSLFSLTPSEAITETLSQFESQGIPPSSLSTYIITEHPESVEGRMERRVRGRFRHWLEVLDGCVGEDGGIVLSDGGGGEGGVMMALEGIECCCRGVFVDDDDNDEDDDDDAPNDENDPHNHHRPSPQKHTRARAIASLTYLHSSDSIYTLMSLLSILPLSPSPPPPKDDSETTTAEQQQQRRINNIFQKTVRTLTSILTTRRVDEREVKGLLRGIFVGAVERLVLVIVARYRSLLLLLVGGGEGDGEGSDEEEEERIITAIRNLSELIRLAGAVTRGSERNKVALVRALHNRRKTPNTAVAAVKADGDGTAMEKEEEEEGYDYGRSTVALLVRILGDAHRLLPSPPLPPPTTTPKTKEAMNLLTELCRLTSILCRYDIDYSPPSSSQDNLGVDSSAGANVSSSHDHVLEFSREGIVPVLQEVTSFSLLCCSEVDGEGEGEGEGGVALAAAAMAATRVLAVNDEIVQAMVACGILRVVRRALDIGVVVEEGEGREGGRKREERRQLTLGAIGLIRNLSGNDEIKTTLCLGSTTTTTTSTDNNDNDKPANNNNPGSVLPSILTGMKLYLSDTHSTSPTLQEHGCGALAAMALRKPANATAIIREDGARAILSAMRSFPENVLVQRQGALAVRNIVSRLVGSSGSGSGGDGGEGGEGGSMATAMDVRDVFLDLGAEEVLRNVAGRHQGSVDESYAALRDLGCRVSMVKIDSETMETKTRVAMFGDSKPNFRAVYEESGAVGSK